MTGEGAWVTLAALGAYHGINPGMGWLFAVGLGLQEGSRRAVVRALGPIALGHEAAVAVVVLGLGGVAATAPATVVRVAGAVALVGFGAWKLARPNRHPRWVGFRVNGRQLVAWSFLMSSAHGAGLMLIPVLLGGEAERGGSETAELAGLGGGDPSWLAAVGAATLHSAAMLVVMAAVAVVVYEKVGLGILRRAWVNLDLIWGAALVAAGAFTLFS